MSVLGNIKPPPPTVPRHPYAGSSPTSTALLTPTQQPIFDSEWYPERGVKQLDFMKRGIGYPFAHKPRQKTRADAFLDKPEQLSNPLEFSVFGFSVRFLGISGELRDRITRDAEFVFKYNGNRLRLTLPLHHLPGGDVDEGIRIHYVLPVDAPKRKSWFGNLVDWATFKKIPSFVGADEGYGSVSKNEQKEAEDFFAAVKRMHKFSVGHSAIRIHPTESFGISMIWPDEVPVKERFKIYVFMHGLLWAPF